MMRFLKYTTLSLVLTGIFGIPACSKDSAVLFEPTGGSGAETNNGSGGNNIDSGNGGLGGMDSPGNENPTIGGPCASDKDCRSISALCDPTSNACAQCLEASDCGSSADCVAGACIPFTECETSLACDGDEVCNKALGRCVECEGDNDCDDEQVCVNSVCATSCSSDKNCTPNGQVCDLDTSACVDCVRQADCDDQMQCSDSKCVPALCSQGQGKCAGDLLLTCNDEGTGYERTTCDEGCDDAKLVCDGDSDNSCDSRVRILMQRSGAMFEYPSTENSWWNAVVAALNSDSDILDKFANSIELSVSTFYKAAGDETCPQLGTQTNVGKAGLSDFFAAEASAHQEFVESSTKVDAPLPEAIAKAASELGNSGNRYLLLIIAGLPDSCTQQDGLCAVDPTIAQLQAAHDAGIRTKLLYLDAPSSGPDGFALAVANAGVGADVEAFETGCDSSAKYSDSSGNAMFAKPDAVDGVSGALSELLTDMQACR